MKNLKLLLLMMIISLSAYSQTATMLPSHRDYIYSGKPGYFVMLAGTNNLSFYKTSKDSLFLNHTQISGLSNVASTGMYSDLSGTPNLNNYILTSDTSVFSRKVNLLEYIKYSDTAAMLLPYAGKNEIPKDVSELNNDVGYLTSYTETDPNVPSYSKSLTAFSVIKSSTDLLYRPITYTPTWSEVTGKPVFFSGNYNDLTNKPTVVQQYGITYTKEWNGEVSTSSSSSTYVFDISSAGFTNVQVPLVTTFIQDGLATSIPFGSVISYSTTSVTVRLAESNNSSVLIGGVVEGLTDFLKSGKVKITVKGN